MKSFSRIGFTFLLLFLSMRCFSQIDTANKRIYKNSLGVAAGFTTGYGLSYRFWPKKLGAQITFWPGPIGNSFKTNINLGTTILFKVKEFKKINLFLYASNMYQYKKEWHHAMAGAIQWTVEYHVLNFGLGAGVEYIIGKRLSFNIMGGYAVYDYDNNSYYYGRWTGLTGETGLLLKF